MANRARVKEGSRFFFENSLHRRYPRCESHFLQDIITS